MLRYLVIALLIFAGYGCEQPAEPPPEWFAPFLQSTNGWADSMLVELPFNEQIAQLFILRLTAKDSVVAMQQLPDHLPGALVWNQLPLDTFLQLTEALQQKLPVPMLLGSEAAVNLNQQFADLQPFPGAPSIQAVQDKAQHQQLEEVYFKQLDELGLHFGLPLAENGFSLAPSAVAGVATQRILRNHQAGSLALGGDFGAVTFDPADTTEGWKERLAPYKLLVQQGLSGLVIADSVFHNPLLDSLPPESLQHYLKKRLLFDGLIIGRLSEQQLLKRMLRCGVDLFIVEESFTAYTDSLQAMLATERIAWKDIQQRVHKVLKAKEYLGLHCRQSASPLAANQLFHNPRYKLWIRQLYEEGITLVNNPGNRIPIRKLHTRKFKLLEVGEERQFDLEAGLSHYIDYKRYFQKADESGALQALPIRRYKWSTSIISLNQVELKKRRDSAFIASVNKLAQKAEVILLNFGPAQNLSFFNDKAALVQVFDYQSFTASLAGQLVFGGIAAKGRLRAGLVDSFPAGAGDTTEVIRLKYTVPEEVGIAPYRLVSIDAIIGGAIAQGACPGAQVMIVKDGKVIYDKAFGHHAYDKRQAIGRDDLYDVASITKVAATTLVAMGMYEQRKFRMNDKLKSKLPLEKKSPIRNLTFKSLFIHQSGLTPNMPVAPYILYQDSSGNVCNKYFCIRPDEEYQVPVADSMYLKSIWHDSIRYEMASLKPRSGRYRYSDVNFNLIQFYIEHEMEAPLDKLAHEKYYRPLHLRHTMYNPLSKFERTQIVPTAEDGRWRKQIVHGYVHDESAALLGGVGGNAGLFSNAGDLAVLFQMLLNEGVYGGRRYFKPATVNYFTSARHGNYRGLGFDKQSRRGNKNCSPKAPLSTFGHTGFTGGCVWADPTNELIVVLLTNRVHPNPFNNKLARHRVRSRIHTIVYDALHTYDPNTLFPEKTLAPSDELHAEMQ